MKTTLGAQLSEVLNADVDGKEENGFSRRRVVAGVAWSLPVIATAIAAPAAAASGSLSITAGPIGNINFSKQQGSAGTRSGQGPSVLTIQNTHTTAQTVTVGIVGTVSTGTVATGIAVKSLGGNTVSAATFNGFSSTATITVAPNQSATQAISFYYSDGTGQSKVVSGQKYTFTMTLTAGASNFTISGITMVIP
ncbi:hypothetical protein [Pseudarthrobacter phenanthrenivorans]|uniref:hypothetical protein n=1 Tax=Pseudarthrobacter phenanthrenivorans TaxID=361575 RepID=UPI0006912C2E|nr:hypothetical protein [Pseudarthrobacter phenanthrenivorans]